MSRVIQEVEALLKALPSRTSRHVPEDYIGGGQSELLFIGLRAAQMDQVIKTGFSFSGLEPRAVAKVWDHIWHHSRYFEPMSLALNWFDQPQRRSELKTHWPTLKKWSSRIDNWAHADGLSGIYAHILEQDAKLVYPTLLQWNRSSKPWLRRLSLVSLLYYSSQRKKVLKANQILPLIENQLDYDHYYVQKGVGWTLREVGNVYPREAFTFLKKNILRISPAAFSAATEKLAGPEKEILKALRKQRKVARK